MTVSLPAEAQAWLDAGEFVTLATVLPDGQPHLSVRWVGSGGDDSLMSNPRRRTKERNRGRDPRPTVLHSLRKQVYRYLEVRGRVTTSEQGDRELIDVLSERHTGNRAVPMVGPDEVRATTRLTPEKVVAP